MPSKQSPLRPFALSSLILALSATLSFAGTAAFAEGKQGEHDHDDHPEGTLMAFEGIDAITKEECALFITDVQMNDQGQTLYTVRTSYAHNQDSAGDFVIKSSDKNPSILVGANSSNQDQLALFLADSSQDIQTAKSFNLKWLHGSHYHHNRCLNLAPHID